jgi:hypothetical protein
MLVYLGAIGSAQGTKTLLPQLDRKISESTKEIRRTTQLASGKTVVDVVARKKSFSFSYNLISAADLNIWLNMFGSDTWELEIERMNGSFDKYQVRFAEETKADHYKSVGEWYCQNVVFELDEI